MMRRQLTLIATLTAAGCQQDGEPTPYCQWVEDVVSLDASFGPWGGDLQFDLTPRKVVDQLVRPQRGELTWYGGGDWINVTPDHGTTGFTSVATYRGTTVYRRIVDVDGNDVVEGNESLACPRAIDFGASISLKTDDGVLDETWDAIVSFDLAANSLSTAGIGPEEVGLPEALQISKKPNPPIPFENEHYWMLLNYNIYLFTPEDNPPTFRGRLNYRGNFTDEQTGEIMESGGINLRIAEWFGSAEL